MEDLMFRVRESLRIETGFYYSPLLIFNAFFALGLSTAGVISYARRIINANESTLMLQSMLDQMANSSERTNG